MLAISRKPERLVDAADREIREIQRYDNGDHTYIHDVSTRKNSALSGIRLFKTIVSEARNLAEAGKFENSLWLLHTSSRLLNTITNVSGYEYVPSAAKRQFEKISVEKELKRVWGEIADQIEKGGPKKKSAVGSLEYLGQTLHSLTAWGDSYFEDSRFEQMARSPEFARAGRIAARHIVRRIDADIDSGDSRRVEKSIRALQSNRKVLYAFGRAEDENRLNARYAILRDNASKTIRSHDEKIKDLRRVERVITDAYFTSAIRAVKRAESPVRIKVSAHKA
ncbi:MAG: hypothetical protein KGH54_01475 [Candidatus Micrarchaeota archaeon]|nr:hypothetical protein [Candidatus Micrarchaeota archaeon]